MRIRSSVNASNPSQNMSAMIDIVFLLLVFFMLTLQIAIPEGVHEGKAQAEGPGPGEIIVPQIRVQLEAAGDGSLTTVTLNRRLLGQGEDGLKTLHGEVKRLCEVLGPENARETDIIIEADYDLKYEFSARALGACSKRRDNRGHLVALGPKVQIRTPRGIAN